MRARRTFAALLLTASLGLAGCSAADSASDSDAKAQSGAKPAEGAKGGVADSGYAADKPGQPGEPGEARKPAALPQTHIIRTAQLSVEVKDAPKALADARRAAESVGGHVANESTERLDDTHVTSRVVLRVPQESYDSVLSELAGAGKLLSRKADAKDVTDQVVDVESRIATQRASVARVRALMDRASKLSDVVTLEGELSSRQAELESLLAQQASLKDRTTLATITLELSETEKKEQKKTDEGPGFLDALGGGWNALVTAVLWIGMAFAAVAPWGAALALLYALWRWAIRPRLPKRTTPAPTPAPAPATAPAPDQD